MRNELGITITAHTKSPGLLTLPFHWFFIFIFLRFMSSFQLWHYQMIERHWWFVVWPMAASPSKTAASIWFPDPNVQGLQHRSRLGKRTRVFEHCGECWRFSAQPQMMVRNVLQVWKKEPALLPLFSPLREFEWNLSIAWLANIRYVRTALFFSSYLTSCRCYGLWGNIEDHFLDPLLLSNGYLFFFERLWHFILSSSLTSDFTFPIAFVNTTPQNVLGNSTEP